MFQQFVRNSVLLGLFICFVRGVQAEEPILLKYQLEKGSKLINLHKSVNKTTQTINGNNMETEINQDTVDIRTIDELDSQGVGKIKTKTERLSSSVKIAGLGDYAFSSQKPDRDKSSILGAALTPLYERLVGSELQYEVSPLGKVKNFSGYAQLVGDLVKANPLTSRFAGGGTDNAAQLGAQGQWVVFSEKPVKPGEKWDNPFEAEMPGLGTMKGKETITFLAIEQREGHSIAKLSISNDVSFDLNIEMGGAKVTGKVTTSNSEGSAEFDITAGKLLSQKSKLTLAGQLSVDANGATIPVQISQTIGSETTAVDKLPE
ncbi:MAG: hypothetical protein JWM11_6794 [Planctomycetaceae bacterium]|nr:hypothetical protein [Planctomycetaceae bacterium]